MAVETHIFDPDGDLLLLLFRPPDEASEVSSNDSDELDSSADDGANPNGTETPGGDEDVVTDVQDKADVIGDTSIFGDKRLNGLTNTNNSEEVAPELPDIAVHMLVSSKHMMLASPVFRAMLRPDTFKEGQTLQAAGKLEVSLPDDDPVALVVLLNIIHGQTRKVPRRVEYVLVFSERIHLV